MRSWAPAKWDPNLKHIKLGACQKGRHAKARGLLLDSPFFPAFQLDIQAIPHTKWEFLLTTTSPSNAQEVADKGSASSSAVFYLVANFLQSWLGHMGMPRQRTAWKAQLFLFSVATLVPKRWTPAILPFQRVFRNKYHFKIQKRPKSWLQSPQVILAQWS